MYVLRVSATFAAAHRLEHYDGPCSRLHGHTFRVEAELAFDDGAIDAEQGVAIDFADLKAVVRKHLPDHQNLNAVLDCRSPTAEHLARILFRLVRAELPQLRALTVWESESCSATYVPEPGA
jgi:6-pyruvoyltetrahydropterin/6-carboxytetrahydropterin synthase